MYAGQRMHPELEMVKWLALLALASALALAVATRVAGQQASGAAESKALPADNGEWLDSMDQPQSLLIASWGDRDEVWRLLDLHRRGQAEAAKFGWQGHPLPADREVWRFIAMGVSHLQLGELDRADQALSAAAQLESDHALVHYYRGVLWLMRGDPDIEWYDRVDQQRTRLVAFTREGERPLPRGMCELAAMTELKRAIASGHAIDLATPLVGVPELTSDAIGRVPSMAAPTVGDLLKALGADNFSGRAHNMLGALCLNYWLLDQAERHMDQAVTSGFSVLNGYRELGAAYEADARTSDAARAYLKAAAHSQGAISWPGKKAVENLGKTLMNW